LLATLIAAKGPSVDGRKEKGCPFIGSSTTSADLYMRTRTNCGTGGNPAGCTKQLRPNPLRSEEVCGSQSCEDRLRFASARWLCCHLKPDFHLVPVLLTCSPTLISGLALGRVLWEYKSGRAKPSAVVAVCGALLIAASAAFIYIYYERKPPSHLPPWKDPETLDLALFGLFAPLGLVTAFVAAVRGASKWVVLPLLVALSILTLVGFMEALSV
jgi:hypothetical protein